MTAVDLAMAFSMGVAGSLHCVGMCGGIVAALTLSPGGRRRLGLPLYHLGRMVSYALLGLLAGLAGALFTSRSGIAAAQQILSAAAGLIMVLFALQMGGIVRETPLFSLLRLPGSLLRRTAEGRAPLLWGATGCMNGLLPCAMVYAVLPLAVKGADLVGGALIMAAFGLGTVPAMTAFGWVMGRWSGAARGRLLRWSALILVLFGLFTMARGFIPLHKHTPESPEKAVHSPLLHEGGHHH